MADINNSNVAEVITTSTTTSTTQEIVQDISVISQIITSGKDWWKSRILWVNALTIIGSLTTYFGFDLKSHGINYDALATAITTILGVANIVLRFFTKIAINSIVPAAPIVPASNSSSNITK